MQNRADRLRRRRLAERGLARHHLVKYGAEAEDVRTIVSILSPHLLGRHVACGAQHCVRLGLQHEGLLLAPSFSGPTELSQPENRESSPVRLS